MFIVLLNFVGSLAIKCVSLYCIWLDLLLNLFVIYSRLVCINVVETVMLLMTYLQNFVFLVKEKE